MRAAISLEKVVAKVLRRAPLSNKHSPLEVGFVVSPPPHPLIIPTHPHFKSIRFCK